MSVSDPDVLDLVCPVIRQRLRTTHCCKLKRQAALLEYRIALFPSTLIASPYFWIACLKSFFTNKALPSAFNWAALSADVDMVETVVDQSQPGEKGRR